MGNIFNRAIKSISNGSNDDSSESNLSKAELKGLKSLQRRIKEGSIVVAETDKSRKFSVLSRKQYIDAGLSTLKKIWKFNLTRSKRSRIQ